MTPILLTSHKQDWEDLAGLDPLWAILSDPRRKFGGWGVDEFFASGEIEIASLLQRAGIWGYPARRARALDFGCGVGRLTRALAAVFEKCYGVDISEKMIELARGFNQERTNCHFIVNVASDLSAFPNDYFDLIYSSITLQHLPERRQILTYVQEFVRTLAVGGLLAFQLPSRLPLRNQLQPSRRVYGILRHLGLSREFLYLRLGLTPIRMNFIGEAHMVNFLKSQGATVLDVRRDPSIVSGVQSCTYFVTRLERRE